MQLLKEVYSNAGLPQDKRKISGNSLAVQWLGLCAFTAEGTGSITGWGTKIPQAARCSQKKKERKKNPQTI